MANSQELDRTRQYRIPEQSRLQWENVVDSKQWLCGVEPVQNRRGHLHAVCLQPGEWTEFLVPAHELVRVVTCGNSIANSGLEIWISNGSGAYRKLVSAISSDERSLLSAPDESRLSIARIRLNETATHEQAVTLFTSRRREPQRLDYYQCNINGSECNVEIKDNIGSPKLSYAEVAEGFANTVTLQKPTRLRIETRLKQGPYSDRRETYWLKVKVGGKLHRILAFDTVPETRSRVFVNDCESLIGVREFSYVDIDQPNAEVTIESSHPVYLRVDRVGLNLCRPRANQVYALPTWDHELEPAKSIWDISQLDIASAALSRSFFQNQHEQLASNNATQLANHLAADPIWDPYLNQQRILQLARNNRADHGGLRAYMWMRAIATMHYSDSTYRDELTVTELATRLRNYYTFFRDLLPLDFTSGNQMRIINYRQPAIRRPKEKFTETIIGEQHIVDSLETVRKVTLFEQKPHDQPLRYRPADDLGPSVLRLVVEQTVMTHPFVVKVQYDNAKPIEFIINPHHSLDPANLVPSRAEVTLSALQAIHERYSHGTLGGPYSQYLTPRDISRAATAELLLPGKVKEIRAWVESDLPTSAFLGLQILDGRKYSLSENAHRYIRNPQHRLGSYEFQEFLAAEIANEEYPLQQLLASHRAAFLTDTEITAPIEQPTDIWPAIKLSELSANATQAASDGQWALAIEYLGEIINHSVGQTRHAAILSRINALISSNEHFLASVETRGWLLTSQDPVFVQQLVDVVTREAIRNDDIRARERILAIAALKLNSRSHAMEFAKIMTDRGRYRFALMALPDLQPAPDNEQIILRCCYQLGWWGLFDETLAQMQNLEMQQLWFGLKNLRLGKYETAYESIQHSGATGSGWLRHWEVGHLAYTRLTNPSQANFDEAMNNWIHWFQGNPSSKLWKAEPDVVKKSLGSATVKAVISDITVQYFLTSPVSPGTISIQGPCRIQIEARPVHTAKTEQPLQDWLIISNGFRREIVPIVNNHPSELLQIQGVEVEKVGALVNPVIELPAGRNVLNINAENSHVLFRVLVERPEIQLPVLPQVNDHTIDAVQSGRFQANPLLKQADQSVDTIRMIYRDLTCCSVALAYDFELDCVPDTLKVPVGATNEFDVISIDRPLRWAIQECYDYQHREGRGKVGANRMYQLIRLEELVQQYPARKDIRRMYTQIAKNFRWERYEQFDSQAGIFAMEYSGWRPETPALRIRKSLMNNWEWDYVLTGRNQVNLNIQDVAETSFRVAMQRPRVSFLPMGPTTVQYRSNRDRGNVNFTDPNEVRELEIPIIHGSEQVDLIQIDPLANHFVGLNVQELLPQGVLAPLDGAQAKPKTRTFQVALEDEPLVFRIAGPAMIRIDETTTDMVTTSKVITIKDSQAQFELKPQPGQEFAYFRIFEMVVDDLPSETYRVPAVAPLAEDNWADDVVENVIAQVGYFDQSNSLDTLSLLPPDADPVQVELNDLHRLGRQELGTLWVKAGFQSRRTLDELPASLAPGRFFDVEVGREYYDPWKDRYKTDRFLVRPRIEGGTTFGYFREGSTTLPWGKNKSDIRANGWGPYVASWRAYGLIQNAGTPLQAGSNEHPWIFGGDVRLSRKHVINENWSHRPTIFAFARELSEEQDGFGPGDLDQDVFTRYKRDHRYGFRFSDRFVYQKCIDRRSWLQPFLATNQDQLTPDNLGFRIGTDQLIGPLQLQLTYRFTGFLSDNDRENTSVQSVFGLDARLEQWQTRYRRSELRFSIRHDANDDAGTSFSLSLTSFLNDARGYRDISPQKTLFKSLKRQRAERFYSFQPD